MPTVTTDPIVLSTLLAELALRQLPCGGWAALASSSQPAIEPTCYSALVLGSAPVGDIERAQDFLLRTQNPNGSWPVFPGDDQEGGWVTSLAVMALRDLVPAIPARLQGIHWLLNCAGRESNWFWKWKFRTADRHVRFDPDKYGWPWFPDTVSWVVPTAFSILALNQIPCACGGLEHVASALIVASRCFSIVPAPVADGTPGTESSMELPLHRIADDTAIALLALNDRVTAPGCAKRRSVSGTSCPNPVGALESRLGDPCARRTPSANCSAFTVLLPHFPDLSSIEDTSTLALVCLALDQQRALEAFGVAL